MTSGVRSIEEVARRIVYLDFAARARMAEWLGLVAEFDRREGARGTRFRGTAEWLAFECQLTARTAREHVRVARRLAEMPAVEAALGEGRLSYAQVRALTRVPEVEDERGLLRTALTSTASELERHVRRLRSSSSADLEVANAGHERRFHKQFVDEDGSLRYFGRLGADDGAAFAEAIEATVEALHGGDACEPAAPRPPVGAQRADALVELALSGGPRTQLVLHADPEALACQARGDESRAGEVCSLRDGPAIPSEMARRLTCDAEVSLAAHNLGRRSRVVSPSLRRALEDRDGRVCAMPGCHRTHGLHAHHIRHWIHGGPTDLDNLVLLCRFHHRLFHDDGFTMRRRRDGSLLMRDARGRELHRLPSRASPGVLAAA